MGIFRLSNDRIGIRLCRGVCIRAAREKPNEQQSDERHKNLERHFAMSTRIRGGQAL